MAKINGEGLNIGGKLVPFNEVLRASGAKLLNVLPLGLNETDREDMAKAMIFLTLKAYNEAPELRKCSPDSIINSLMDCATLGMMPFSKMNECAIIPYGGKASMQLMYRGILKLCRNTGEYKNIRCGIVREGDSFKYMKGLNQILQHFESDKPTHNRKVTHVYALYELINRGTDFEVMTIEDLEVHRDKYSKQYKKAKKYKKEESAIWFKEPEAMSAKTVLIKLLKFAPKSDKLVKQLALDRDVKREIAPERKDFTKEKEAEFIKQRNADATGVYDEDNEKKKKEPKKFGKYYAMVKDAGIDKDKMDKWVKKHYKVASKKDLTAEQMDEIYKKLDKRIKAKKEEAEIEKGFDESQKDNNE